jgi:hypothetical protein
VMLQRLQRVKVRTETASRLTVLGDLEHNGPAYRKPAHSPSPVALLPG